MTFTEWFGRFDEVWITHNADTRPGEHVIDVRVTLGKVNFVNGIFVIDSSENWECRSMIIAAEPDIPYYLNELVKRFDNEVEKISTYSS